MGYNPVKAHREEKQKSMQPLSLIYLKNEKWNVKLKSLFILNICDSFECQNFTFTKVVVQV